jgi:transketolase
MTGGIHTIVSEILLNQQITTPVLSLSLQDRWFKPALLDDVLQNEGFTGSQIASKVFSAIHNDQDEEKRCQTKY